MSCKVCNQVQKLPSECCLCKWKDTPERCYVCSPNFFMISGKIVCNKCKNESGKCKFENCEETIGKLTVALKTPYHTCPRCKKNLNLFCEKHVGKSEVGCKWCVKCLDERNAIIAERKRFGQKSHNSYCRQDEHEVYDNEYVYHLNGDLLYHCKACDKTRLWSGSLGESSAEIDPVQLINFLKKFV